MNYLVIKLIAIAYVSLYHIVLALFFSRVIDIIIPDIDIDPETQKENPYRSVTICIINIILLTIAVFAIRNIGERIPFPLHGKYGYNHLLLKERNIISLSYFLLMYYQKKFRTRLDMLLL